MPRLIKMLILLLPTLLLSSCMYYLERGLGGGGMGHYSDRWEKRGATHNDVLNAMRECGYTDFDYGYGIDNSKEVLAQRQECMYSHGFLYDGWGGFCSMPEYMATLTTCKNAHERPQRDYSEKWKMDWASKSDKLQAMKECGYTKFTLGYGNDNSTNAFAAREECLFSKGYTYGNKWGGLCSELEYRSTLPACKNAPVRSK